VGRLAGRVSGRVRLSSKPRYGDGKLLHLRIAVARSSPACSVVGGVDTGRMTQLVPLPDGRTLAVDDHGTSTGPVVVFLPSAPGSRLLDPDRDATAAAEVRLLTVDRPGCGASSPMPDGEVPTLGSIADDVAHAVTSLGVETAAVVGWSAGGRVAPEMVPAVRADPPAAVPMLATDFAAYPDSPDQAVASVTTGPADERAFGGPAGP
jgi:alpha/beta hydrolase fold